MLLWPALTAPLSRGPSPSHRRHLRRRRGRPPTAPTPRQGTRAELGSHRRRPCRRPRSPHPRRTCDDAPAGVPVTRPDGVSAFPGVAALRVGLLTTLSWQVLRALPRRPFQGREFIQQSWFFAGLTILPPALVAIPSVVIALQLGSLTAQIGAESFTGAAACSPSCGRPARSSPHSWWTGPPEPAMCADLVPHHPGRDRRASRSSASRRSSGSSSRGCSGSMLISISAQRSRVVA